MNRDKQQLAALALRERRAGRNPSRVLAAAVKSAADEFDTGGAPGGESRLYSDHNRGFDLMRDFGLMRFIHAEAGIDPEYDSDQFSERVHITNPSFDFSKPEGRAGFVVWATDTMSQILHAFGRGQYDVAAMVESLTPAYVPNKGYVFHGFGEQERQDYGYRFGNPFMGHLPGYPRKDY